jgi:hypothetical protein
VNRAEIWPFQDSSHIRQETFQADVHDWAKPDSQAGPSQKQYPFNVQMSQTDWADGNVDPPELPNL